MNLGRENPKSDQYYRVPNVVIRNHGRILGPYGVAVYNALAFLANPVKKTCSAPQEHVAFLIGISYRAARYHIKRLEELKLIGVERKIGGISVYSLLEGVASDARQETTIKPNNIIYINNTNEKPNKTLSGSSNVSGNSIVRGIKDSTLGLGGTKCIGRRCQGTGQKRRQSQRKNVQFPRDWYNQLEKAYQELKGIRLRGKEFDYLRQDIKTMFMSERRPEEIIAFMKWLAGCKETWAQFWTIRTVKMKLPEFLSGKLKTREEIEREKNYLVEVGGKRYYTDQELEHDEKQGKIYWDYSQEKWLPVIKEDDPGRFKIRRSP